MHSFAPSLSFLLSFFLLPLLHWPQIGVLATFDGLNNQPPVNRGLGLGLQLARAAEIHHASKVESESESPVLLQDNASSSLTQPGGDDAAPPTRHSGAVKQVKNLDLGLSRTGGGHSRLAPPSRHRRHAAAVSHAREVAPGNDSDVTHFETRAAGAKFTNYATGLGACGGFNKASDFVVALNTEQWDNGAHCYATITITINGQSTQAQIVDECGDCGYNNIDLTDGLFAFWAANDFSVGTLYGDWEWGSGAQPTPTPTPTPPPKTTQQPTTTRKPATTSSVVASSSSVSNTNSTSSATSNSTAPSPTQSVIQVQSGNLELMYLSTVGMGGLLMGTLNFTN